MNTKALSMNIRIQAVIEKRHQELMQPLGRLESTVYRPKSVAERARIARAKREEREATRW